jgi:DNA-binding NtrC family response regulator
LFYRLNVLPITIPPLRERLEDIPSLADAVLAELVDKYGRQVSISAEAMGTLLGYSWPGNVRELRNAIGRGFMMTEGLEILPEHLPVTFHVPVSFPEHKEHAPEPGDALTMHAAKSERERELIMNYINRYHGNFTQAARALGVHRATLYSKMHAMGISIEQFRPDQKHI